MKNISIKNKIIIYLKFIRLHQWLKNLLIILPIVTTQKILYFDDYKNLFIIFITFSLISSLAYMFNDLIDQDTDKKHPIKKNKPLPKQEITIFEILFVVIIIGILLLFIFTTNKINNENIIIIFLYFVFSLLYSIFIKKLIFIDVFLVSIFYVFRIRCGVNGIDENIDNLIYFQIYTAALFVLFCKRYSDLVYTKDFNNIRNVYTKSYQILKILINISLIVNIIIYILITNSEYLISKHGDKPYYISVIFVLISFLKYRYYTLKKNNTIDPVKILFKSKTILASNIIWLLSIFLLNNL